MHGCHWWHKHGSALSNKIASCLNSFNKIWSTTVQTKKKKVVSSGNLWKHLVVESVSKGHVFNMSWTSYIKKSTQQFYLSWHRYSPVWPDSSTLKCYLILYCRQQTISGIFLTVIIHGKICYLKRKVIFPLYVKNITNNKYKKGSDRLFTNYLIVI